VPALQGLVALYVEQERWDDALLLLHSHPGEGAAGRRRRRCLPLPVEVQLHMHLGALPRGWAALRVP
jgi:hypothetical protein